MIPVEFERVRNTQPYYTGQCVRKVRSRKLLRACMMSSRAQWLVMRACVKPCVVDSGMTPGSITFK